MGGQNFYCLKFVDDIATVADGTEYLQLMLNELKKFNRKNRMVVNINKTKIMVFRNGGKLNKWEKFKYKGVPKYRCMEVVQENRIRNSTGEIYKDGVRSKCKYPGLYLGNGIGQVQLGSAWR